MSTFLPTEVVPSSCAEAAPSVLAREAASALEWDPVDAHLQHSAEASVGRRSSKTAFAAHSGQPAHVAPLDRQL